MRWMATEDLDAKRYAAAEESIACALSAHPDDPRSRYLNGRLLRDTARTTSNFREAIQEFQFVLEAIPDQGSTHRELGYTYTDVKEYDKALQHLQRYLDLKPEAEDARDVKAAIKAVTVLQRTSASQEDW
jgi:tetratricopeptide (TPR) repeat protein